MLFLSMEDQTGVLDVILFPDVYRRSRNEISTTSPFLVTGTLELESSHQDPILHAEKLEKLT